MDQQWILHCTEQVCRAEVKNCFFLFQFEEEVNLPEAAFILTLPLAKIWEADNGVCQGSAVCSPPQPLGSVISFRFSLTALQAWYSLIHAFEALCRDWWTEKIGNVFSCMAVIFYSDSPDKISFLPFLLSFCVPACFYLPCGGTSCILTFLYL